ncbi:DUF72 domain-containing protein [Microbacteriaceae bacterium VKM Ac-2855]|nr:DUF72 domain-containing protein [Microbacteriaceae bacterium VKM Ac-2855]
MIRIGTSGWSYDHWVDVLYPRGRGDLRLSRYAESFDTVETNSSFYHWPREHVFASWRSRVPEDFLFAVKAPRGLTHAKRLYDPDVWIERIGRGMHEIAGRRGPLLVQLRPDHERDDARLAYFLQQLPPWLTVAVEFRHPSWQEEPVFRLLERFDAAYCVTSGAGLPCILRATSELVYVRLHGPDHHTLYAGSYTDDELWWWAERMREWEASGHTVLGYFNNDGGGNAVRNALTLKRMLGR